MTAQYNYAIATGHDATSLTNVEDLISVAPKGKPIPLGSTRRVMLNQNVQTNGVKNVTWSIGALSWADFESLIVYIFGDFDTESANMTIDTRGRDEQFHRGNVVAILPVEGEDYQRRAHGDVEALVMIFRDFNELGSGFTTGFSLGFEA